MILDDIVAHKKEEYERQKKYYGIDTLIQGFREKFDRHVLRDFTEAVSTKYGPEGIRIIAEVKRASPSKGVLRENFYPYEIARMYDIYKAAAVSVVTEEKFFKGRVDFLGPIKTYTKLPVLRKDFLFEDYHIYESRAHGADAVLLIVAILEKERLKELMALSASIGMATLVEVHDEAELEVAIDVGAKIIGVNNRDLKTFEVDVTTTSRLAKLMPKDRILVSESGISTHDQIMALKAEGVSAFLIGETLLREENIGKKLKELRGADWPL